MEQITFVPTFSGWQAAARRALAENLAPSEILWEEFGNAQPSLSLCEESESTTGGEVRRYRVPKAFVGLANTVACHREASRWALLYRVLWRLTHGEPKLLEIVVDPEVHALLGMEKAVRHDVHKMRAFVRFRVVTHEGQTWHVAWFEPEHHIVEKNAPFFRDRFAQIHWSILTPERCVHWDGANLTFTGGVPKSEAPTEDAVEDLWRTYYGNIFNPARVKIHAMQAEMPKRYWKNLPEASLIPSLLHEAPHRVDQMISKSRQHSAQDFEPPPIPETTDLGKLGGAAAKCEACPLYKKATQTVFG